MRPLKFCVHALICLHVMAWSFRDLFGSSKGGGNSVGGFSGSSGGGSYGGFAGGPTTCTIGSKKGSSGDANGGFNEGPVQDTTDNKKGSSDKSKGSSFSGFKWGPGKDKTNTKKASIGVTTKGVPSATKGTGGPSGAMGGLKKAKGSSSSTSKGEGKELKPSPKSSLKGYGKTHRPDYSENDDPPPPYSVGRQAPPPPYHPGSYGQQGPSNTYWNGQYYPYRSHGYSSFFPLPFAAAPLLLAGPFGLYGNYGRDGSSKCAVKSVYVNGTTIAINNDGSVTLANGTFIELKWNRGEYLKLEIKGGTYQNGYILEKAPNVAVNGTYISSHEYGSSNPTTQQLNPNVTVNGTELTETKNGIARNELYLQGTVSGIVLSIILSGLI